MKAINLRLAALASSALCLAAATPVFAEDLGSNIVGDPKPLGKGDLLVTLRVTDVSSPAKNYINVAGGGSTGLRAKLSSSVMPTLGITYFLTDHVSAEVILGTTNHNIYAAGGGATTKVSNAWVIPPVVTVQYRPLGKSSLISPYVGVGVNAMLFYDVGNETGFHTKLSDAVGYAVQAGVDAPITRRLTFNLDVKKVFVSTTAKVNLINGGSVTPLVSHVRLDPWVPSVGIGYRF